MKSSIEGYTNENGFIDIPKIISESKEFELFPGLIGDIHNIRQKDFPLLDEEKRVYLDSAATSLEP